MSRSLIQCEGAPIPPDWASEFRDTSCIEVNRFGPAPKVTLRLQELSDPLAATLVGRAHDLVGIASYVYVSDQLVSRGGTADIFGKNWRREIAVCLPVSEPEFWNMDGIRTLLEQTLNFVSGESWRFAFSASRSAEQLPLANINQREVRYYPDSVILFSGGVDSLCATVEAVVERGLKPVLVSHRSVPLMSSVQKEVVEQLRKRIPKWKFPHSKFTVNKVNTKEHDTTQRTRSFLFASLGAAVASSLETQTVILADNGVASINMPINGQLIGSLASRSTHPKFIELFNALARAVLPHQPQIYNPLCTRTKAEGLEILKRHSMLELLQATNSCAHRRNLSNDKPQCGVCSQCVDRRFASLAAGVADFDPPERYRTDIFRDILTSTDITMVESYIRYAKTVQPLSAEAIYMDYPQVGEAILPEDPSPDGTIREYVSLIQRHAASAIDVVASQVSAASRDLILDKLPPTCLISLSVLHDVTYPNNEQGPVLAQDYWFKKHGDFWSTRFEGKQSIIRNSRGMDYIARLLANPNKDIPVFDFVSSDRGASAVPMYQRMSKEELETEGLSISGVGDAGEVLDDQAKKQYRERLREIEVDLAEAERNNDLVRAEKLEDEKEALVHEVKAAVGLGGRDRKAGSVAERSRVAVSLSIRRAMKRIRQHDQKLAQFLDNAIQTGITCKYSPDQNISWLF